MAVDIFLVTPPFTQLNTPYPATAYLKGFLNTKNITSFQMDLGIETILAIFSRKGLTDLFDFIEKKEMLMSENAERIFALKNDYIATIDNVIAFLQGKNPTLANLICQENFLPEAGRFQNLDDIDWAFGTMGIQDKAKHLSTLYLEDISDVIIACVDANFGFSRYAEKLARCANSFDELYDLLTLPNTILHLQNTIPTLPNAMMQVQNSIPTLPNAMLQVQNSTFKFQTTYIDKIYISIFHQKLILHKPKLLAISVPFPGNLYAAFRLAQWVKLNFPEIKICLGGGFPNTELRNVSDVRVFEFFDFITLDDGEAPIEHLLAYINNKITIKDLKRTFVLEQKIVRYYNESTARDYKQSETGTPDYSDLDLTKYISVIEIANPMHRLWSDGRWNKLTMAHGCYWGKCTFCDVSLDYIKIYQPVAARLLCDRMEELIQQTGENGFHFVDEAAPPALMRDLALEIIRRNLTVSWWTNIRFEKNFTHDLCQLLKASGCIAVSGGLEVASDRLLALIEKGVTVAQVAQVCQNFTKAGIMVHAYLMYGYPTQTKQETVDSLEMVRQLFEIGVLQSGFWHQFALTAHSPIGIAPHKFGVKVLNETLGSFANNDLLYTESTKEQHEIFSFGLKKSLFNFMHGIGLDTPLQEWFDFKIPKTTVPKDYIEKAIQEREHAFWVKASAKVVFLGNMPKVNDLTKIKKGKTILLKELTFYDKKQTISMSFSPEIADFILEMLTKIAVRTGKMGSFQEIKRDFEEKNLGEFELFWYNKPFNQLRDVGLLVF